MYWGWFSHTQCTGLSNRTNEWWKVGFKSVVLCTYPQYESLWASSEMYVKEQLGMDDWNIMSIAATKGEMTKQKKFHTESCSILIFFTKLTRIPAGEDSPEYQQVNLVHQNTGWWKLTRIPAGEDDTFPSGLKNPVSLILLVSEKMVRTGFLGSYFSCKKFLCDWNFDIFPSIISLK